MTDEPTLIERLRRYLLLASKGDMIHVFADEIEEAADELERLQEMERRVKAAREMVEGLAKDIGGEP